LPDLDVVLRSPVAGKAFDVRLRDPIAEAERLFAIQRRGLQFLDQGQSGRRKRGGMDGVHCLKPRLLRGVEQEKRVDRAAARTSPQPALRRVFVKVPEKPTAMGRRP